MSTSEESLSEMMSGAGGLWREGSKATGESTAPPADTATPPKVDTPPEAKAPEAKSDPVRDETGRFKKAEGETAEKPQETKPRADVAAIIDERRKRQEADRKIAELEAQLQEKHKQQPSVFDNEDEAFKSRLSEHDRRSKDRFFRQSMKIAQLTYKEKYDEAASAFLEASERDPRLVTAMQDSDDPGEYVYTMGIHIRELSDVGGDLMKYRDKVTGSMKADIDSRDARIKALEAELAASKEAQKDLESVPTSLNKTSSGPSPRPGDNDPEDLKSIVRFGNKSR